MNDDANAAGCSTSGIVTAGGLTGISSDFSDIELIPTEGYSLLARAKRYGRWWMLKGLKEEYRGQLVYRTLLEKEFSILVEMQHPGIVVATGLETVRDFGLCIVMEWIDGTTLKEWLRGKHSRAEKRDVALQLMQALAYVHSKQTAHRDLKPSNVLITRNGGQVKLIDFGLSDTDQYDILKQPAGSAGYVSPEQRTVAKADVRNDVYSLGCLLSELRLGLVYAGVVRRCRAKAERRYQSVTAVERAFRRCARVRTMVVAVAVLIAVGALADVVIEQRNILVAENEAATRKVDSLEMTMKTLASSVSRDNESRRAVDRPITKRSDSAVGGAKVAESQEKRSKERQIDDLIRKGKQELKRIVDEKHFERIDNYEDYHASIMAITVEIQDYINRYLKDLSAELTETERATMFHALYDYYSVLTTPLHNRQMELVKKENPDSE